MQTVPAVLKFVPGGSAILGFLVSGALIGPYGLKLIVDTGPVKHLAEIGVIFLLFNLGLELSLDRLIAMAKQVRGIVLCAMPFVQRIERASDQPARCHLPSKFCALVCCS